MTPDEVLFDDLTLRRFLQRHWQREPLLVRNAWGSLARGSRSGDGGADPSDLPSDPQSLITTRTLFALARDPDVESRLVLAPSGVSPDSAGAAAKAEHPAGWRLRHGPFSRLPPRRQPGWTLLVQGVDLHLAAARALMDRFRFLPDARLDDLMVSFATDAGGVGPHVDSYDVFLLQVAGRRRWQIAAPGVRARVPDAPLRLLADFRAEQGWVLNPGDMLYLPPGWGHEGTAVGDCMTCSIGFRSPSKDELRQAFFSHLADLPAAPPSSGPDSAPGSPSGSADAIRTEARYRDRIKAPVAHPAEIPEDMARTLNAWVRGYRPSARLIDRFIGCYLTEPKPSVWFDRPEGFESQGPDPHGGNAAVTPGTSLALDRKTRMLYRGRNFYINGEAIDVPSRNRQARQLLTVLADRRSLDAGQTDRALRDDWLNERLREWLASGWLR